MKSGASATLTIELDGVEYTPTRTLGLWEYFDQFNGKSISGVLKAKIQGAAISEIEILETPVGLNEVTNLVFAENNDNGIGVNSCFTNTAGIVTCFLATPISGFTAAPFAVGD